MPQGERLKWISTGGKRIGSADNYTDFDSSGRQSMAGTGRVYGDIWLPAQVWYGVEPDQFANAFDATITGATCTNALLPRNISGGEAAASPIVVPTLAASVAENLDARAATAIFAPPDAASSGSSNVYLYYTTSGVTAKTTTGCIQAWRVHWQYFGSSTSDVGGVSGSFLYGASMASTGSGKLEIQTLGQINAFRSASPLVVLQLTLEGSNASSYAGAPDEQIYGARIRYVRENLGVQVS